MGLDVRYCRDSRSDSQVTGGNIGLDQLSERPTWLSGRSATNSVWWVGGCRAEDTCSAFPPAGPRAEGLQQPGCTGQGRRARLRPKAHWTALPFHAVHHYSSIQTAKHQHKHQIQSFSRETPFYCSKHHCIQVGFPSAMGNTSQCCGLTAG